MLFLFGMLTSMVQVPQLAASSQATITYFDRQKVTEAFLKGAVLAEAKGYAVHASRRDRPGIPEVHESDVDIMYMIDGTATIVTGGELVGAKTVATGEIRGTDIRSGQSRKLSKGDVIIIPAGIPHWFKEVPGPLTYYVVKTRH
jgi:mannose-6-phosphate isomerase-like protein (cupin superfamily)